LVVVVFPNLRDIKCSGAITSKVSEFFRDRKVRVLDLQPLLENRDPEQLVVNSLDAHPNEALNKEVADLLTRYIQ
jgi:hypothetical protein